MTDTPKVKAKINPMLCDHCGQQLPAHNNLYIEHGEASKHGNHVFSTQIMCVCGKPNTRFTAHGK